MASIPHKQDTTNTRARYQNLSRSAVSIEWDLIKKCVRFDPNAWDPVMQLYKEANPSLSYCLVKTNYALPQFPGGLGMNYVLTRGMSTSSGLREQSSERHWAVERTELVWDYMHVCLMTSLFIGACALIRVWSYRCVSRVAKVLAHISQAKREVHTTSPSRPLWICP